MYQSTNLQYGTIVKSVKTCRAIVLNRQCSKIEQYHLKYLGVCKSRNPTRNTRNPPGTPGIPPGTPGTLPRTPGTPPGTPGTPPGTRWNTSYEATHVFLYKFTCFALNSWCWMVTIFTFTCIFVF